MDVPVGRRNSIPIIYVRGSHYEVGYDVGRTFKGMIQDYLKFTSSLNDELIPLYETDKGRQLYEETLNVVSENFPQYVKELEGTADGAEVPFYKLFLLHMGSIVPKLLGEPKSNGIGSGYGCSTICCNEPNQTILGHTEDAFADTLGYFYFVSAHIISDKPQGRWNVKEEKFTSLCYPGHLPGFTMSYNHHGMIYSINVISARDVYSKKTPEFFLCRALLAAENFSQAEEILKDKGCGSAEGFSVNMTFLKPNIEPIFYNIEVGAAFPGTNESILHTATTRTGEYNFHCNKYLRLRIPECGGLIVESSDVRQKIFEGFKTPKTKGDILSILSHQSEDNFTFFRDYKFCNNNNNSREPIATIAVGIFDCVEKTWSIYTDNPKRSEPVLVIPLDIKSAVNP